jgi:hypothetical protein
MLSDALSAFAAESVSSTAPKPAPINGRCRRRKMTPQGMPLEATSAAQTHTNRRLHDRAVFAAGVVSRPHLTLPISKTGLIVKRAQAVHLPRRNRGFAHPPRWRSID